MDDDILIADKTIPELSVRVGQWLEADDLITIAGGTDRSCELASIRADVENDVEDRRIARLGGQEQEGQ